MTLTPPLATLRGLVALVDPGRSRGAEARALAARAADEGVAALLVGDSFGACDAATEVIAALRDGAPSLPIVQFPATAAQLQPDVDAVLLLSLVSGRNAQYLIDEHVRAVPFFERHPHIEVVSTAYLLIDGGRVSSVEAVSQTRPLPSDKPEMVRAHVSAARLIGMRATYLEAGSGATRPIAPALIRAAREASEGLLLVGGGVRDAEAVRRAREAGADLVVVGTLFEREPTRSVRELAHAARA